LRFGDFELRVGDGIDDRSPVIDLVLAGLTVDRYDRIRIAAEVPLLG